MSASCTQTMDVDSRIADAETTLDQKNYPETVELCANIVSEADTSKMTVTQLCRMAMVYARLADNDVDPESNIAVAMRFFDKAYSLDADSADAFVATLPVDNQPAARIVLHLMGSASPDSLYIPDHEMPDSCYTDDIHTADHDNQ